VGVARGLGVDGAGEIELFNDLTGAEIEVVKDDLEEVAISLALSNSAVRVDVNGERLCDTDGVGDLDKAAAAELSSNEGLGNPASSVSSRAVDLGRILTGEGTTTVSTPTTVSINNDLTTSQTSITVGTTDDELARGVKVENGLVINELSRDDLADDVLTELALDGLVSHSLVVLSGDDDGVDTDRNRDTVLHLVEDRDLSLTIRADPRASAVLADLSEASTELGSEDVSKGHELLGLISSITEHVTLVTSANLLGGLVDVDTLGNIGGLLLNSNDDVAGLVVNTLLGVVVADLLEGLAHDSLVVHLSLGSDLTEDHDHASLGASLASDLGVGVLLKASVKDSVRNLVADLVGVTLVHGFRGEQEVALGDFEVGAHAREVFLRGWKGAER